MRISTIFGISISLATGIVLGWGLTNDTSDPRQENSNQFMKEDRLVAYTPIISSLSASSVEKKGSLQIGSESPQINPLALPEKLLSSHRPLEALSILIELSPSYDLSTTSGKEWLSLLVDAYTQTENIDGLSKIYSHFPSQIIEHELASLLVSDSLLSTENNDDYLTIRNAWRGQETQIAKWTFLDAQEKVSEGKFKQAAQILQNKSFNDDNNEFDRLTRLAALYVSEEPKKAWGFLSEAVLLNPDDRDIHTFRAGLAEILGRHETAASEYISVMQLDPANPETHEALADFYLRTNEYQKALKILQSSMEEPTNEGIWLKTYFWSKSALPIAKTWKNVKNIQEDSPSKSKFSKQSLASNSYIPESSLKEFIVYLDSLPEGTFWDKSSFNQLERKDQYLDSLQETYWLQLLDDLKNNRETQALDRLKQNQFREISYAPSIEEALITILNFRNAMQNAPKDLSIYASHSEIDSPQALLELLANLSNTETLELPKKIPLDLYDYLLSKDAFVIPFLAANWTESAIQLHSLREDPASFPGWITASFARALEKNRGQSKAIAFAATQKSSPSLSLCLAEMALEANEKEIAFNALKKIYTSNSEEGQNAALLLGQFLMEHNNLKDAKKALEAQPTLSKNPEAKEILARIAVQENDLEKASKLYSELELHSSEAKSFLACQAFNDKNWKRAKQLITALLAEYPENPVLMDNLKKIIAEESKMGKFKKITP